MLGTATLEDTLAALGKAMKRIGGKATPDLLEVTAEFVVKRQWPRYMLAFALDAITLDNDMSRKIRFAGTIPVDLLMKGVRKARPEIERHLQKPRPGLSPYAEKALEELPPATHDPLQFRIGGHDDKRPRAALRGRTEVDGSG